jgi:hypothetical protein
MSDEMIAGAITAVQTELATNPKLAGQIFWINAVQDGICCTSKAAPTEKPIDPVDTQRALSRAEILDKAKECVCGQREQDYGSPENNFGLIGALWSTYLGMLVTAADVAMMMALFKIARIKTGTGTADSFVDLAGYAACGGEVALHGGGETQ